MSYSDALLKNAGPANPLRIDLLEHLQSDIEPAWGRVAELLMQTLHGEHCVVSLQYSPDVHETLATAGLTEDWEVKYEERFAGLNPFVVESLKRRPTGGEPFIATADSLVPFVQLKKMPFYREFWAPLGINDSIGILLFDGPRSLGHISIRRHSGNLRYGEAEEARLRSVMDILKSALARSYQLRMLEARAAAFERLNVDSGGGLIVFDERGSVLEAEGIGKKVLDSFAKELHSSVIAYRQDTTRNHGVFGARQRDAFGSAVVINDSTSAVGSNGINDNGHKTDDGPFYYEFRRSAIEGRARVLCILQERRAAAPDAVAVPPDIHFTPRERDVLQLLGRGLDNLSIAKTLTIGLYTTKDHVKSIFRKLNVKTRAEAVAVLARGSIPSGCMWSS